MWYAEDRKQETVDDADVAVVEPSESKGECMEEEFDSGDENVAAVDHFGSGSNDAGLEPESGLAAVRDKESRLDLSP